MYSYRSPSTGFHVFKLGSLTVKHIYNLPHSLKGSVQRVASGVGYDRKQQMQVDGNPPMKGPPNLGTSPHY